MKTAKLGPFVSGMNTRAADYALPKNQYGAQVACRDALNLDVLDSGHLRTRDEASLVQAFAGAHSGWSDGTRSLLVRSSALYRVTGFAPYAETLIKVLTNDNPMTYAAVNGEVWLSNGTDFGRLSAGNVWSDHAMPSPAAPTLAATTGSLPAGKYQVALCYSKADGEEGGQSPSATIELASTGGITVPLPAALAGASHIRVFCSSVNGTEVYLHSTVAVGTASVTLTTPATGRTGRSGWLTTLPPGRLVYGNGRLFSFSGSAVYWSEPFALGLYNPVKNFALFPQAVTVVAPNQNGTYICADKTYWFAGADIDKPEIIRDVLPYGAALGSQFAHPSKPIVGWYGSNGVVVGDSNGEVKAVQEEHVAADSATSAASCVREVDGLEHVVVVLNGTVTKNPLSRLASAASSYSVNLNNGASSRYDLTHNTMFLAHDGNYYTLHSDGIYRLVDATTTEWVVDIGKLDFGSQQLKHVSNAYVGAASEDKVSLVVGVEGSEYTYAARSSSAELQQQRFDTGKGLRANWFNMTLTGSGAVEIADFNVPVAATTRRI